MSLDKDSLGSRIAHSTTMTVILTTITVSSLLFVGLVMTMSLWDWGWLVAIAVAVTLVPILRWPRNPDKTYRVR